MYNQCEAYEVPFTIMLAIIEHESGYLWHDAKLDTNGLPSVGFAQINKPNWGWLAEMGIDVHEPYGNLTAGVVIMAMLLEGRALEKALVCYQCGVEGAQGIDSTAFSRWVIKRANELEG